VVHSVVIVTRTGSEGQQLAQRLTRRGLDALHLPLIRLEPVADGKGLRQAFRAVPRVDGLILTSREGVRQAAALGLLDALRTTPTVVPGEGTRALALELGLEQVDCPSAPAGNSEAMLAMARLNRVHDQHWLILAARDGRRLLDTTLRARGAHVHRLTVYRRSREQPDPAAMDRLRRAERVTTLLASGSALDRLRADLPSDLWRKLCRGTMIVPSERLQARASALGIENPVMSAGASDDAMTAALIGSPSSD
jgi:uroporphyrinogen-III synthase